jgi:hypothetical protein
MGSNQGAICIICCCRRHLCSESLGDECFSRAGGKYDCILPWTHDHGSWMPNPDAERPEPARAKTTQTGRLLPLRLSLDWLDRLVTHTNRMP